MWTQIDACRRGVSGLPVETGVLRSRCDVSRLRPSAPPARARCKASKASSRLPVPHGMTAVQWRGTPSTCGAVPAARCLVAGRTRRGAKGGSPRLFYEKLSKEFCVCACAVRGARRADCAAAPAQPRGPPPAAARSTAQDISARAEVKSSCERSGRPWGICLAERGVALARATKRGRGT